MDFCPTCGTLLQVEPMVSRRRLCFSCPTCPYVCAIHNKIVRKEFFQAKKATPIFVEADAKQNWAKTEASCPNCRHGQAYYSQMQIRSADEPMSTFYLCANENCNYHWRED